VGLSFAGRADIFRYAAGNKKTGPRPKPGTGW